MYVPHWNVAVGQKHSLVDRVVDRESDARHHDEDDSPELESRLLGQWHGRRSHGGFSQVKAHSNPRSSPWRDMASRGPESLVPAMLWSTYPSIGTSSPFRPTAQRKEKLF